MTAALFPQHRERPRLTEFRFERLPNGRCRAGVKLLWAHGEVQGHAEGLTSPSGDLRCAAQACIAAVARGAPEHHFELLGVKTVRAFDTSLVVVALAQPGPGASRLVGTCVSGEDLTRAAATAVLHAVNRVLTKRSNEEQGDDLLHLSIPAEKGAGL
jgi:hypothetical protein